ncbi:hypothetical protein ECANGB1_395 [Enterospora canceri]|uniref:Uncharacterized protein n=1 Tax=Enterospora canceri TaxID=1081671 RepID=A0A1Y1S813_9MICR|nr:hypothetical protein ECANGB1_395 [Enterospora canceri]
MRLNLLNKFYTEYLDSSDKETEASTGEQEATQDVLTEEPADKPESATQESEPAGEGPKERLYAMNGNNRSTDYSSFRNLLILNT